MVLNSTLSLQTQLNFSWSKYKLTFFLPVTTKRTTIITHTSFLPKGVWRVSCRCLKGVWRCLEGVWKVSGEDKDCVRKGLGRTRNILDQSFFGPKIFRCKIFFFEQNFYVSEPFQTQKYFGHKTFEPPNFLDPIFFGTQIEATTKLFFIFENLVLCWKICFNIPLYYPTLGWVVGQPNPWWHQAVCVSVWVSSYWISLWQILLTDWCLGWPEKTKKYLNLTFFWVRMNKNEIISCTFVNILARATEGTPP